MEVWIILNGSIDIFAVNEQVMCVNVAVKSGSFIYDADLKFDNWKPAKVRLLTMTVEMIDRYAVAHIIC